jgi:hypothetical protein
VFPLHSDILFFLCIVQHHPILNFIRLFSRYLKTD